MHLEAASMVLTAEQLLLHPVHSAFSARRSLKSLPDKPSLVAPPKKRFTLLTLFIYMHISCRGFCGFGE